MAEKALREAALLAVLLAQYKMHSNVHKFHVRSPASGKSGEVRVAGVCDIWPASSPFRRKSP